MALALGVPIAAFDSLLGIAGTAVVRDVVYFHGREIIREMLVLWVYVVFGAVGVSRVTLAYRLEIIGPLVFSASAEATAPT